MGAKPNYRLPDYEENLPKWELTDDCDKGQKDVKSKGDVYLPRPNPTDISEENLARYEQYLTRALFSNFTQKTISGLVGEIFGKPTEIEIPKILENLMVDDVDDTGVTLDQQMRKTVRNVTKFGRSCLFVDYPQVDGATVAQTESGEVRPSIICYDPRNVINWRAEKVGNAVKLSLVVIEEQYAEDDPNNPFQQKLKYQWRVLKLEDGVYMREIWRRNEDRGDDGEEFVIVTDSEVVPLKSDQSKWDEIPFTFVGSQNNDPEIDLSPIYDLSSVNIAHYRNSADYEESCFIVGQPMYYMGGLTQAWVDKNYPDGLHVGSRRVLMLPVDGNAGIVQASPNTLPFEAMQAKEKQMAALGAKLLETDKVERTATQSSHDRKAETSILATIAQNVSSAYEQAMLWAWEFISAPQADSDKITIQLNDDFTSDELDPQQLQQLVASWQAGAITRPALHNALHKAGIEDGDYEAYTDSLDSDPAGLVAESNTPFSRGSQNQDNEDED